MMCSRNVRHMPATILTACSTTPIGAELPGGHFRSMTFSTQLFTRLTLTASAHAMVDNPPSPWVVNFKALNSFTNDYTASTLQTSGLVGPEGSEGAVLLQAPASAAAAKPYILLAPSLCCFCPWGAGTSVWASTPHVITSRPLFKMAPTIVI